MHRYTKSSLAIEIVVVLATVVMLLPFWILLVGAFKSLPELSTSSAIAPPVAPTVDNFLTLLSPQAAQAGNIVTGFASSAVITAVSVVLLIVMGSLAAYVFARNTSRWTNRAYFLILLAIVLPTQLGTLPLYIGARSLELAGTVWGMILIYTGLLLPLAVFLYGNFFRSLPRDYEEAALLDGASRFQIFARVVFPLMGPATGTVAIIAGLIVWNDFFAALIFLGGTAYQTLPVVLYSFVGSIVTQWNLVFALVILSMIPILAFYVFAQRKFIQGFAGGLKG